MRSESIGVRFSSAIVVESILAVEEEHAEDLKTLLESVGEDEKKA